jgi:YrbI family 3-deoxy-D-manno-octulosonate 8-phosphate phosphatase
MSERVATPGHATAVEERAWALIPARGGSKSIPKKNLQKIRGRSLIARAVEAARAARHVERVFVSTDDSDVASGAADAGAEVMDRPVAIAGDAASSEEALLHALDSLEQRGEALPEILALVQCTSPFVSAADIDGTIACLLEASADTAHTVMRSHGFLWRRTPTGRGEPINHDKRIRERRQDRKPEFLETGAVYAMRVRGFRVARHRFFGETLLYEVPALRAMQIDEPDDLTVARAIAPVVDPVSRASVVPSPLMGIVFDFDGVMTDDRVVQDQTGNEAVVCSRSDGLGIEMLRHAGIAMIVLSRERNPVVAARCRKLGLVCKQEIDDKVQAIRAFAATVGSSVMGLVYLGNDVNDLECMRIVGLSVAVADAHPRLRLEADLVLSVAGGRGAVRELADIILSGR